MVRDLYGKEWTPMSADCVIAADTEAYEEIRRLVDGSPGCNLPVQPRRGESER